MWSSATSRSDLTVSAAPISGLDAAHLCRRFESNVAFSRMVDDAGQRDANGWLRSAGRLRSNGDMWPASGDNKQKPTSETSVRPRAVPDRPSRKKQHSQTSSGAV